MIHWLKVGGMKTRLKDENKQWNNINEYIEKYPNSEITIFIKTTGDTFEKIVKLKCDQNYDNLDLDCNSLFNGSVRRISSKPKYVELCKRSLEDFISAYKIAN